MTTALMTPIVQPWPAALTTPLGPASEGVASALMAAIQASNSANNTADFNSEGIIQKGYVTNPPIRGYENTQIQEGQVLFIRRGDPEPSIDRGLGSMGGGDAMAFDIVNLAQMNMLLEEEYRDAIRAITGYREKRRGLIGGSRLIDYLDNEEDMWAQLFDNDGEMIRNDSIFRHYYYLCRQGIMERWNLLGISMFPVSADAPAKPSGTTYFPLNVGFKGIRKTVRNIFGPRAVTTAKTYVVLKRRENPFVPEDDPERWGAWGWHPVATCDPRISLSERAYLGLHGGDEMGIVKPIGMVRDSLGDAPTPERMLHVQGLHPQSSPEIEFELAKELPRIDLAIHWDLGEENIF